MLMKYFFNFFPTEIFTKKKGLYRNWQRPYQYKLVKNLVGFNILTYPVFASRSKNYRLNRQPQKNAMQNWRLQALHSMVFD